jgi:DNA primase
MEGRADLTRVDVRLAVTDQPYKDFPWFIRCREKSHRDSTHSLAVYREHLVCYGCGFRIDRRMESLAYLLRTSVIAAIKRAPEFYEHEAPSKHTKATRALSPALATVYQGMLWTGRRERLSWLRQRGLSDDTIKQAMIGHDTTRFTIPVFDQAGNLVTIRFRRDDLYGVSWWDSRSHQLRSLPKYSGIGGHNEACLYPALQAGLSLRHLVVCEGELDALRLRQEGYNAITVTNGAGSMIRLLDLLPSHIDEIWIVGDQDAPGRSASIDLYIEASTRGLAVALARWDLSWGKDVTDLYLSGHSLDDVKWTVNGEMAGRARHPATSEFRATA